MLRIGITLQISFHIECIQCQNPNSAAYVNEEKHTITKMPENHILHYWITWLILFNNCQAIQNKIPGHFIPYIKTIA